MYPRGNIAFDGALGNGQGCAVCIKAPIGSAALLIAMDVTRAESMLRAIESKRGTRIGAVVEKRRKCGVRFDIRRLTKQGSVLVTDIERAIEGLNGLPPIIKSNWRIIGASRGCAF
jgi:hypothetical protein